MKSCKNLKGGLQEVAEQLDLERIGPQHQAGSDSLLTGMAFFKMKEVRVALRLLSRPVSSCNLAFSPPLEQFARQNNLLMLLLFFFVYF